LNCALLFAGQTLGWHEVRMAGPPSMKKIRKNGSSLLTLWDTFFKRL
jgi:hypothetical protein